MNTKGIDRLVIGVRDMDKATRLLSRLLGIEFREVTSKELLETANVRMCVGSIPQLTDRIHLEILQPLQPVPDLKPPFVREMAESLEHAAATVHAVLFRVDDAARLGQEAGRDGVRVLKTIERETTVVGGTDLVEVVLDPEDTLDIRIAFMEYDDGGPDSAPAPTGKAVTGCNSDQ